MTRAAQYLGNERIEVAEVDAAAPGAGEVLIDVAYTGICGTDLHILHGAMDARVMVPAVLGHEMSGTIAAIGADVAEWSVGDLVTVMPLAPCGDCPACAAGHSHICHRLNFIGIDSPGAMQQSWVVPTATLIRVPTGMELRTAALAEPTAVAAHDVRRSGLRADDKTLVVGGGPIGVLIALVATHAGADVLVSEPNEARRAVLASLGIRALSPLEVGADLDTWTAGAGADVAFEVSGVEAGLELALMSLKVRGTLTVVAIHSTPVLSNLFRVFWRELTIVGARVYEREDFDAAVQLLADGVIPADAVISAVRPLDEAAEAFALLAAGGDVMKVLIDCGARA